MVWFCCFGRFFLEVRELLEVLPSMLCDSKLNSENDERPKACSRHSLEADRFGYYKSGGEQGWKAERDF